MRIELEKGQNIYKYEFVVSIASMHRISSFVGFMSIFNVFGKEFLISQLRDGFFGRMILRIILSRRKFVMNFVNKRSKINNFHNF